MIATISSQQMAVSTATDVIIVRRLAKAITKNAGFTEVQQEEVILVVSELATNIIKHATRGIITLEIISDSVRTGVAITSQDNGPGFDPTIALADGYSTTKSLGRGLGVINRFVDQLDILTPQQNNYETVISCKKWLMSENAIPTLKTTRALDIGVVSKPKPGQDLNGDAFFIKNTNTGTLIALIDGLGHGYPAYNAAAAAKQYIQSHLDQSIDLIFEGVDRACLGTNGVVMSLAHFDWSQGKLVFAGVGNISAKLVGGSERHDLSAKRGILGRQSPTIKQTEVYWHKHLGLVMHSDGLSYKWYWKDFSFFFDKSAQFIAEHMHRTLLMHNDDASLIFVKW